MQLAVEHIRLLAIGNKRLPAIKIKKPLIKEGDKDWS
jgi:hypothetical protein